MPGALRRRTHDSVRVICVTIKQSYNRESGLRNHQAIVQPRLYDCLMVTQITLKTEGPHGLPSNTGLRRLIRHDSFSGSIFIDQGPLNETRPLGAGPARGPWTNLGRLPLRVFSIGKYAFQKKRDSTPSQFIHRCRAASIRHDDARGAPWPGLIILTDCDCGSASHSRELSRARTQRLVSE